MNLLSLLPLLSAAAATSSASLAAINITNIAAVRGNLYLPPTAPDGSNLTWSSSNTSIITPSGEVTRQPTAVNVTLTAAAGTFTREFAAHVLPRTTVGPLVGYGFVFFTGDSTAGENIFLAASVGNDALAWRELNDNQPVLRSEYGTRGLRDPFIMRSHEGDTFYLLATDLSIGSGTSWGDSVRHGSRYLEVWESHDLVSWGAQRHVLVSPPTAGNTWAPEAYYDTDLGSYVVYWASELYPESDPDHTTSSYHRMMYATTRDFVTFSDPVVWQDANASRIDSTVLKHGANFHRFTKDEGATSTGCTDIIQERSTDLLGSLANWTRIDACIGKKAGASAVEGPTVFKSNPDDVRGDKFYLFVDEYGGRGYIPLETPDIETPNWTISASYRLPTHPRHGTVLPVTAAELANLYTLLPPTPKANADGLILSYDFAASAIVNGSIPDTSGNGFDGVLHGSPSVVNGSMVFDGVDDYVQLPANMLSGITDVSIEVELFIDTAQKTPYFIYGVGNTVDGAGSGYVYATGTPLRAAIASGNWATEQVATSNAGLARNQWIKLLYTVANGTSIVYVDGVEVGRDTNATLTPADVGNGFTSANYLGKSLYDVDNLLQGKVRRFAVYNRALSPVAAQSQGLDSAQLADISLTDESVLRVPIMTDATSKTITFAVKPGTDLAALTPTYSVSSDVAVYPASGAISNMTEPVFVTLADRATNATVATWTLRAFEMRSPVLAGKNADPNIAVFNGTYYIYPTTDGLAGWSANTLYVWKSSDLVSWTRSAEPLLTLGGANSSVPWASGNAWAPTIIDRNGKYYLYFSGQNTALGHKTIGAAVADSPEGPFTAQSMAMILNNEGTTTNQAIDPAAFVDPATGKYYLFWGNGKPLYAELSDTMVYLSSNTIKAIDGLTNFREGIFVNYRNGRYHMTYSIDDTGSENYRVGYATASSVDGPWEYRGILLQKDASYGIYATGHNSIINVPGTDDWYIAYHRWAIPGGDGTNREVTIDKLNIDGDGYFEVVEPTLTSVQALGGGSSSSIGGSRNSTTGIGGSSNSTISIGVGISNSTVRFRR